MKKSICVSVAAACYYFAYSSEVDTFLKQEMASSMDHYVGENSTTADSIAWNFLQLKFDCCGIDSHEGTKQIHSRSSKKVRMHMINYFLLRTL